MLLSSPTRTNALPMVLLLLVLPGGCGRGAVGSSTEPSAHVIQGKDSAGAIAELEKQGNDLARARVIDLVLGTGEAVISSGADGYIEFTVDFPAGVAITYHGQRAATEELVGVTISGTWEQHPRGVFGSDFGTWEAPTSPSGER